MTPLGPMQASAAPPAARAAARTGLAARAAQWRWPATRRPARDERRASPCAGPVRKAPDRSRPGGCGLSPSLRPPRERGIKSP